MIEFRCRILEADGIKIVQLTSQKSSLLGVNSVVKELVNTIFGAGVFLIVKSILR